mmetsp:Transcript_7932/g.23490  ORF Transcript_7932/g.23490 Transcript_7932/m.23490 type:complete len:82 (+) Transcript_7932:267-512(+)
MLREDTKGFYVGLKILLRRGEMVTKRVIMNPEAITSFPSGVNCFSTGEITELPVCDMNSMFHIEDSSSGLSFVAVSFTIPV